MEIFNIKLILAAEEDEVHKMSKAVTECTIKLNASQVIFLIGKLLKA